MIVVTGGAGFIGSNLVAALADLGETDILVSDRFRTGEKWRNLAKHEVANLVHPDDLLAEMNALGSQVREVFHLGAISSTTETDADLIVETNFRLSLDLWHWCSAHHTPLVYASSAATYGDGGLGFDDEATPEALARLRPLNAYGWSKHAFDRRVVRLAGTGGATPQRWVGLKFFNVYGPNEYHKGPMRSVAHKAWQQAAAGEPVTLFRSHHPDYPDGGQKRDFVYVKDCVEVMLWLRANPGVSGLFNLGTGTARTFEDLARAVFAARGEAPDIRFVDTPEEIREKYQYFTKARMDRLREAGYDRPFHSLEEGVADYVRCYLETEDPYR